jgi:hypothetical protein
MLADSEIRASVESGELLLSAPTLADVAQSVSVLERTVGQLTEVTRMMARDLGWVKYLLSGILVSILVGLAVGISVSVLVD